MQALEGWLRAEMACHDENDELEMRMFEANPELRAVRTARMAAAIEEGARIIAEDTGQAPDGIAPASPRPPPRPWSPRSSSTPRDPSATRPSGRP